MSRPLVVHALIAIALVGCTPATAPASVELARTRVEDVFRAVAARDCPAARALMPTITSDEGCTELFEESADHGMQLLEIVEASRDGRDAQAVIVRCRVQMDGDARELLVRAEVGAEGRWAISM